MFELESNDPMQRRSGPQDADQLRLTEADGVTARATHKPPPPPPMPVTQATQGVPATHQRSKASITAPLTGAPLNIPHSQPPVTPQTVPPAPAPPSTPATPSTTPVGQVTPPAPMNPGQTPMTVPAPPAPLTPPQASGGLVAGGPEQNGGAWTPKQANTGTIPGAMPGAMPMGAQLPGGGTVNDYIAKVQQIDPANDLRNKVIAPEDDPVLDRSRQAMSDAQTQLAGFDRVAALTGALDQFGTGAGARTDRFGGMVDDAASQLAAVDRVQMAKDLLAQFDEATAPEYERDVRMATRNGAAMGRLGSGDLRTELGNLALVRGRDRSLKAKELMTTALRDSIDDQFRKTGVLSDLERRARGDFESDRDFARGVTDGVAGDRARALEAARSVFGTIADESTGRRNELRGEREYQVGQEASAFDRALRQYLTEHGVEEDRFNRSMRLIGAGEAGNPANIIASLQSAGIDPQLIAALAQTLGASGGGGAPSGTP